MTPVSIYPLTGSAVSAPSTATLADKSSVYMSGGALFTSNGSSLITMCAQVACFDDLMFVPKTANGVVFVHSYRRDGKGGGGVVWCDINDTTSTSNGGTIFVAADGGCWKRASDAPMSIRGWGGACTRGADDTARLQTAINWQYAQGGGDITIEWGTSVSTVTLYTGVGLIGTHGAYRGRRSVLQQMPNAVGPIVVMSDVDPVKNANGIYPPSQNMGVAGIKFVGNTKPADNTDPNNPIPAPVSIGCWIKGQFSAVVNCQFFLFNDQGVIVEGIENLVEKSSGISCLQNRNRTEAAGAIEYRSGTDHKGLLLQFGAGYSSSNINFPSPVGGNRFICGVLVKSSNCFFDAVQGENADVGWYITRDANGAGGNHRMVNCRGDFVSCESMILEAGMVKNVNYEAQSTSQCGDALYDGIVIKPGASGAVFTNAQMYDTKVNGCRYGFNDQTSGNDENQRTKFRDCSSTGHRVAAFSCAPFLGASPDCTAQVTRAAKNLTTVDANAGTLIDLALYDVATTVTEFIGARNRKLEIIGNPLVTLKYDPTKIITNTGQDKQLTRSVYTFTWVINVWIEDGR